MLKLYTLTFAAMLVAHGACHSQTLCDVEGAKLNGDHFEISFKGSSDFKDFFISKLASAPIEVGRGARTHHTKKDLIIAVEEGERFILAGGLMQSCVFSVEKNAEGRLGLYMEEMNHVDGEAPRLITEFAEVY